MRDIRDSNDYTIAKLADGKCWMTQNLRLGRTTTMLLTQANSDVSSSGYTLPAFTTVNAWCKDLDGECYGKSQILDSNNSSYGVYYSWHAATAGSGTASMTSPEKAQHSICPKGWRLPASESYGELQALADKYPSYSTLISTPVSLSLAGQFGGYDVGTGGYYWGSTARSAAGASFLYLGTFEGSSTAVVIPVASGGFKNYGFTVRCLAR